MNERIKELIEQAVDYAAEQHDFHTHLERTLRYEAFKEKFAELIVKECLNQCYNRDMNDELYAGQLKAAVYAGQLKAAAYIEDHFGVE
jgi:hypothetical protein